MECVTFISCKFGRHVPTVECDEGPLVPHGVTVVGRREDSDTLAVVGNLVPIVLRINVLNFYFMTCDRHPP